MNCSEFRHAVGAQPHLDTDEVRQHATECEACNAHWSELRQMDQLIYRALRIDVDAQRTATRAPVRPQHWRLAASVLMAALLGSALWVARPRTSLAEQVAAHALGEASAMVSTSERLSPADVAAVLQRSQVRLNPNALDVSYAMSCWFRGHYVPHLIVQTRDGPVTVLVLRHEQSLARSESRTFTESGLNGVIVAAPEGALAVLARGAAVDEAAMQVLRALDYGSAGN